MSFRQLSLTNVYLLELQNVYDIIHMWNMVQLVFFSQVDSTVSFNGKLHCKTADLEADLTFGQALLSCC